LRDVKIKQKIGKFRSLQGAKIYRTIKSTAITYKKNGTNFLEDIHAALINKPIIL